MKFAVGNVMFTVTAGIWRILIVVEFVIVLFIVPFVAITCRVQLSPATNVSVMFAMFELNDVFRASIVPFE